MKKPEVNKIITSHTNRLLASTSVSLTFLIALLLIHRGQSYSSTILATQAMVMVLCVVCAAAAVVMAVMAITKKKTCLVEYIILAVAMAFCLYCLHGVGFVTIKVMKYVTAIVLVAYLVVTFAYHTIASKLVK